MRIVVQEKPSRSPRRPRSVTMLAWLHFLQSLILLGFGVYLVITTGWVHTENTRAIQYLPFALFEGMISGLVTILLAVFGGFIAIALLRLRSWAWSAAMILQGLGLLAALYGYIRQRPNYIGMLIGIVLVLYLNQRDIQAAFRSKRNVEER